MNAEQQPPSKAKTGVVCAGTNVLFVPRETAKQAQETGITSDLKAYDYSPEFLELENRRAAQSICLEDPEITKLRNEHILHEKAMMQNHIAKRKDTIEKLKQHVSVVKRQKSPSDSGECSNSKPVFHNKDIEDNKTTYTKNQQKR